MTVPDPTPATAPSAQGPSGQALIGISISDSPDLAELGFGKEHLDEMAGSIARAVLRLSERQTALVYGGDLRPGGHTRYLFDIAAGERADIIDPDEEPPRRLYNYLAWPYYTTLSKTDETGLINLCHVIRITPRTAGFDGIADDQRQEDQRDPPAALVASRCLTRMRALATDGGHPDFDGIPAPPLRGRILIGGATGGYSSFMPGLFEEFLIARERGAAGRPPLPLYLVGAFGGAAKQLADALLDPDGIEPLSSEFQREHYAQAQANGADARPHRLDQLLDIYRDHADLVGLVGLNPEHRYEQLRTCVQALGAAIRGDGPDTLDNGLTPAENRTLLCTRDDVEIRRLIQKGLLRVCE